MTAADIEALGYLIPRQLPNGEWIAIMRMPFTVGLFVGITEYSYRTRFCYADAVHAVLASIEWDGTGDPPGPWIKEKGSGVDRMNPAKETRDESQSNPD